MRYPFFILLRKIRSFLSHLSFLYAKLCVFVSAFCNSAITIGAGCSFGKAVKLKATDGGRIQIGQGVCLSDGVQITVYAGCLTIEDGVFIGIGSIIVCQEKITIGSNSLIAEYVVIRDQDHRTDIKPLVISGFHTDPISIGRDVWIGCKATVLRGSIIGDRCVIGAHALVNSIFLDNVLAVGIPARAIKSVSGS